MSDVETGQLSETEEALFTETSFVSVITTKKISHSKKIQYMKIFELGKWLYNIAGGCMIQGLARLKTGFQFLKGEVFK